MLKFLLFFSLFFSVTSFYDVALQSSRFQKNRLERNSIKRKLASDMSLRQDMANLKQPFSPDGKPPVQKDHLKSQITFGQWSKKMNADFNITPQKKRENLKKLSPSELMSALRRSKNLPKEKRFQSLRTTARRFIPESFLFYLAGNLVSLTDHSLGVSDIGNPRFFKTELEGVLSAEGGAHFFTFIFFNQMYAAWSKQKIKSGTASVKLNKFLKSAANSFAGMAVAGLGASIVFDLGSMIYHCGLNTLQKVEETRVSDIFQTPEEHFAACDNLYLRFVSGKMEAAWVNELLLGLIPAAVLAHGFTAGVKLGAQKIVAAKNWLQAGKKAKTGALAVTAGRLALGAKTLLSTSWAGAAFNFAIFVGMERWVTAPVARWGSKKINLGFLKTYQSKLKNYFQKGLDLHVSNVDLKRDKIGANADPLPDQCVTKECIQSHYINGSAKVLNSKGFLYVLNLYGQTFRERRELLLAKGQEHYQNWMSSFEGLILKHDEGFKFYNHFIEKIIEKNKLVQPILMPLAYILPGKNIKIKGKKNHFVSPQEVDMEKEVVSLSDKQRRNLLEALTFLDNQTAQLNKSPWFLYKKTLIKQLAKLKRQLFSKDSNTQLIGFKNLQTLAQYHDKKFVCHSLRQSSLNCSVVDLYNELGKPQSDTYLDVYIRSWAMVFKYSHKKKIYSQTFANNLVEDFLLSMVCGKTQGEISNIVGWDKDFYPPKIISLKNNSCKFQKIRVPSPYMLCDQKMGDSVYNTASSVGLKDLNKDFQCAKFWEAKSHRPAKYSVMNSYFAVSNKKEISTYNSLAELVVKNLSKKFIHCSNSSCKSELALDKTEGGDLSVFRIWWTNNVDPYILKQMNQSQIAIAQILDSELLPAFYNGGKYQSTQESSLLNLLSKNISTMSIMQLIQNESLVYQKIIKKIYNKYCQVDTCIAEFNQWSKDINSSINELTKDQSGLDLSVVEKLSKNLQTAYEDLFYILIPSSARKVRHYFQKLDSSILKNTFQITDFEKEVLTITFKSLNAQLFELSSYQSLILERE